MKKFAELFKKYRLRAEFETFASFGDALSEKGYHYEESIFSHWQKGTRLPTNRRLLLKIIEIFVDRDAIRTIDKANEFISSTGLGYLTDEEIDHLQLRESSHLPFQVPSEMVHFTGRHEILEEIKKEISHQNVFSLYGSPGIGKTALAVRIGHMLRSKFPDGVLWYKVDSSNVMDILLSIAYLFGEDISAIKDIEVRASIVRTLLAKKKVLIIFDNVINLDNLHLLLPNSSSCCVIFSSQEKIAQIPHCKIINLHAFTDNEVLELFTSIFDKNFVNRHKKTILAIGRKLGNLPLALHIAAHVIASYPNKALAPESYLEQLDGDSLDLETLTYEDKNLFKTINIGFESLDNKSKNVFISLGVFEGKDFSLEAVALIDKISIHEARQILERLWEISFVEGSEKDRYRIHPLMKVFARKKMKDSFFYLRAALYYEQLLNQAEEKQSYKSLMREVDNIVYVFKKCYDSGYWDQIITLWNPIEKLLSETHESKKLRSLAETIDTSPSVNNLQKILTVYLIFMCAYWIMLFFNGLRMTTWNNLFGFLWSLIPFIGGIVGLFRSKSWGFFQTNIGKAIFYISAGIFSWGSGNMTWVYYNFFQNVAVPYPSFADLGYFVAGIFWIIGIIYLSKATGAKFSLKQKRTKIFLFIILIIIIVISYYFLLFVVKRTFASDTPIKILLDLSYPTMDMIILTIAIIISGLSVNFFRGKYKLSLFAILGGFIFMYLADFSFSYTTSLGIYYNGNWLELLFCFALYLLTWGTLSFYLTPKKKSRIKK